LAVELQVRRLTPEPLNVAPALVGLPLATPSRRGLAMAIDLGAVALLSGIQGLWLVGGLALVVLQLRSERGAPTTKRTAVGWVAAVLLGCLAWQQASGLWSAQRAAPEAAAEAPASAASAASAAKLASERADPDDDDEAAPAADLLAGPDAAGLTDAQRIERLQAALAEARKPRPWSLHDEIHRATQALGASFGWAIVYFSLLPAWWGGQTLGKKLLRLRVIELTGRPMTVLRCLRRYGGYAAGMATGGLGFVQMFWDHNRQAIQDRTAHTVVVDLRRELQPSPIESTVQTGTEPTA
jgi:hypothetical protein